MTREQVQADRGTSRSWWSRPPDDGRMPGGLRRSCGKERRFRDRGNASDSEAWRAHKHADKD